VGWGGGRGGVWEVSGLRCSGAAMRLKKAGVDVWEAERENAWACENDCLHGLKAMQTRTGLVTFVELNRTAESPGPSLAGRAYSPSMGGRVKEMHVEAAIPTPDPTHPAKRK
jgi:hypothetical protein